MPVVSLKKEHEFDRVFKEGTRHSRKWISVIIRRGDVSTKLGIVINKKFGCAARRNRAKRLIREAFKRVVDKLRNPAEIIVIPKKDAALAGIRELEEDLGSLILGRS